MKGAALFNISETGSPAILMYSGPEVLRPSLTAGLLFSDFYYLESERKIIFY
jgi:hypothetical protein